MADPTRSDEPQRETDAHAGDAPKGGGFGAFSDTYRARWAANHPGMRQRWPAAAPPTPSEQADGAVPAPDAALEPLAPDAKPTE